jgi:hypothetical protein
MAVRMGDGGGDGEGSLWRGAFSGAGRVAERVSRRLTGGRPAVHTSMNAASADGQVCREPRPRARRSEPRGECDACG